MRIRNILKKSRTNGVLKFKGGSRSHKAVVLDILRECRRILQKNNMLIPEWFEGTSFETGFFTSEGQFVEKKNCFPSNHKDVIAKSAIIEDDSKVVKVEDDSKVVKIQNDSKVVKIQNDSKVVKIPDDNKVDKIQDDSKVDKIQDHYEGSLTGIEEPATKTGQDIELLLKGDQVSEQIQTHIEKENSLKKELGRDPGYESDCQDHHTHSQFGLSDLLSKTQNQTIEDFEPWFMPKDETEFEQTTYSMLGNSNTIFGGKSEFGAIGSPSKNNNKNNSKTPITTNQKQQNYFEDFANDVYSHWESKIWKTPSGVSHYL
ncbi:uncharacterized protein [Clytia hemisphaerica]|uniref:uncharacterized protein n=1 Tax=Clytia hemisphaerica TaxID=252671 RepID=UPI0034D670E0